VCSICSQVGLVSAEILLALIAKAIKAGASPEHFRPVLDEVLGTQLDERDPDLEQRWEDSYNGPKR
jgi:hypothetical protein